MTIIESGIIAGIPTGAIIGGVICNSHGIPGAIGGSLAGMISGAAIGWLYAYLIMFLLSVAGVLWRSARKRVDTIPAEADMELMTPIGVCGVFIAGLAALVCWFSLGWPYALAAAFVIGSATAVIATGRCELR
jgi:hypothetical protein